MKRSSERGFVLITTVLMLGVLIALLGAYTITSNIELASTRFSKQSATGFYAAEAGLNLRADNIRQIFVGYNQPSGSAPSSVSPCEGGNTGSGDYRCVTYEIGGRDSVTYMDEDEDNPYNISIPQGERYQYLNAQEYRYTARAISRNVEGKTEALLELRFRSRLVPLFQFAAFFNKDLEINPGPHMTLNGPVHTNGDLYMNPENQLDISGQVTVAGRLFRGRKNTNQCLSRPVNIKDPLSFRQLVPSCNSRVEVNSNQVKEWNDQIQIGVPVVTVPEPDVLDPTPGALYWDRADLRIVLRVRNNSSHSPDTAYISSGIEVRRANNEVDTSATNTLHNCSGSVRRVRGSDNALRATGTSHSFYNVREGKFIRMLDVDVEALLNCLHNSNWFGTGKRLNDDTEGGLVLFLTVDGQHSLSQSSPYGVRVRNGSRLQATVGGAPLVKGLTIVSDQAVYVQGNYNNVNKIPAAILADSFNVLSQAWYNTGSQDFPDERSTLSLGSRVATETTQNFAILAGSDTTGGIEGPGGQGGAYNGGYENFPRFHETWSGRIYRYLGSIVSLNRPRRVSGVWISPGSGGNSYDAPNRQWAFDEDFNVADNLPPITPRFVYLRQELFVRDFERDS